MKCPHCNVDLQNKTDRGIDASACPNCGGMWFTPAELDKFEDTAIDPSIKTGSLYIVDWPTELKCPVCTAPLKRFDYRFFDLQLDCCPEHGFWLEAEDDRKIIELMRQETASLDRKYSAEQKWTSQFNHLRSPTFFSKLKQLFHP